MLLRNIAPGNVIAGSADQGRSRFVLYHSAWWKMRAGFGMHAFKTIAGEIGPHSELIRSPLPPMVEVDRSVIPSCGCRQIEIEVYGKQWGFSGYDFQERRIGQA